MVLKRLIGIEKKMSRNEEFAAAYEAVINSYIEKGYARKLPAEEAKVSTDRAWYPPHFGMVNPTKSKKLRRVFDAATDVDGFSLNSRIWYPSDEGAWELMVQCVKRVLR